MTGVSYTCALPYDAASISPAAAPGAARSLPNKPTPAIANLTRQTESSARPRGHQAPPSHRTPRPSQAFPRSGNWASPNCGSSDRTPKFSIMIRGRGRTPEVRHIRSLLEENCTLFLCLSLIGLDPLGKGGGGVTYRHDNKEDCFVCVRDKAECLNVLKMMRGLRGDKQPLQAADPEWKLER